MAPRQKNEHYGVLTMVLKNRKTELKKARLFENEFKIWKALPSDLKRSNILLLVALFFGAILELLGVTLLIPFISFISLNNPLDQYPKIASYFSKIGLETKTEVFTAVATLLGGFFLFRTIYMGLLYWKQAGILTRMRKHIQDRVFEWQMRNSYEFHLKNHSVGLLAQVKELDRFLIIVLNIYGLFIDIIILALFFLSMGLTSPLTLITLGIAGVIVHRFLKLTKKRVTQLGAQLHALQITVSKRRGESLAGIKEGILLGRIQEMIKQHRETTNDVAYCERRSNFFFQFNRPVIELIGVLILLAIISYEVFTNPNSQAETLSTTVFFAAALVRSIPSINRIASALQVLRGADSLLSSVVERLDETRSIRTQTQDNKNLNYTSTIQVDHVSYQYSGAASPSLKDVSIRIKKNQSVGIIGTTGSGKSTLVDVILGLLTPSSGSIKVDGTDIQEALHGWRSKIGYVPQNIFLSDDTIRRNIAFGVPDSEIDEKAIQDALRKAQLFDFVEGLPKKLDTIIGERGINMSGGQRQRVGIARALYHNPEVLVFDEATSALDHETEKSVMDAIDQLKGQRTLIIIAHRLSTIENCDVTYKLEKGVVIEEKRGSHSYEEIATGRSSV